MGRGRCRQRLRAGRQCRLLEEIDYSLVKQDEILDGFATKYRVGDITYGVVLAYNTEKTAGKVPEGWADFFDTTKIPGKRGLWKYSTGGVLEFALMADGVKPADLYPLDLDRARSRSSTRSRTTSCGGNRAPRARSSSVPARSRCR